VGERFESLGYVVLPTLVRGNHGIDLNVERQGVRAIGQCKHWPARGVGEHVLRDLNGALHHVAAQAAHLVTTGNATRAAREWANDKPIHIWDWHYIVEKWSTEIAELAARTSAAMTASSDIRPSWYVYVDDENVPCAVRVQKFVAEQPLLGFQPLHDRNLEVLPSTAKMQHVYAVAADWRKRSLPIATEQHRLALYPLRRALAPAELTFELTNVDGTTEPWRFGGDFTERITQTRAVRDRRTRVRRQRSSSET
jgi:hypothetical protein